MAQVRISIRGEEGAAEAPAEYRLRGEPRRPGRRGREPWEGGDVDLGRMTPAELFGRAVRYLRKARTLRQSDLAARAGISLGRLSAIEHGTYQAWEGSRALLARALDFDTPGALLTAVYGNDYPPGDRADPPGEEP